MMVKQSSDMVCTTRVSESPLPKTYEKELLLQLRFLNDQLQYTLVVSRAKEALEGRKPFFFARISLSRLSQKVTTASRTRRLMRVFYHSKFLTTAEHLKD